MIKVILEALDGNPITPRTGKHKVQANIDSIPLEGKQSFFYYDNEDCESTGVVIMTYGLERIENELLFNSHEKRAYKITIKDMNE